MVTDELNAELSTIQQIASALTRLDPAARRRVLHWIRERFQDEVDDLVAPALSPRLALASTTDAPSVSEPELSVDEALSVAALDDFFDARPTAPASAATGLLHAFASEFEDIAREWDSATHAVPAAS